jgi:hypothetical protein
VPRAKYAKPTGRPPTIKHRSDFRFRPDQCRKLTELLASKLAYLGIPPEYAANVPKKVKTLADFVIYATEEEVCFYQTISVLSDDPINAASVRVSIRRLREALKPLVLGWVDDVTAEIIPAELDERLAARDREIAKLNLPAFRQRALAVLCQNIEVWMRQIASANGETVSEQDILRYVDVALTYAGIKHPKLAKHRKRLAALVFPKS